MRSTIVGIGICMITLFVFVIMYTVMQYSIYQYELESICNESIYGAELILDEEEGAVNNTEDFIEAMRVCARKLCNEENVKDYYVKVYGADNETGLMHISLCHDYHSILGGGKTYTLEAKRTMVIDAPKEE